MNFLFSLLMGGTIMLAISICWIAAFGPSTIIAEFAFYGSLVVVSSFLLLFSVPRVMVLFGSIRDLIRKRK